ncbi:hypothetical protein LV75_005214 [Actinokineospora diospyrosa]|uniref:Uncharacterized protein n=1 Tax=Actinokineospora diospyrosa TaxID=103728 RepID=A0ABT1IJG7_9PSEU|nr:hypothetical protein [Actinokineospora diospyrosa]
MLVERTKRVLAGQAAAQGFRPEHRVIVGFGRRTDPAQITARAVLADSVRQAFRAAGRRRRALPATRRRPAADLVWLVSDDVHRVVVRRGYGRPPTGSFQPTGVRAKEVDTTAWLFTRQPASAGPDLPRQQGDGQCCESLHAMTGHRSREGRRGQPRCSGAPPSGMGSAGCSCWLMMNHTPAGTLCTAVGAVISGPLLGW